MDIFQPSTNLSTPTVMDIIPKSTPTRIDFPMMDITMMDMIPSDAGLTAQGREWAGNVAEGVWNVPLYLGKRKRPVEQSPGKAGDRDLMLVILKYTLDCSSGNATCDRDAPVQM
ncbi:hypothetical protein BD769DRAFT_1391208 [Suillus cothurnatus]|nr:hypothetical protein BD769DRAFT_1391208 [Suillus cothurnatus]